MLTTYLHNIPATRSAVPRAPSGNQRNAPSMAELKFGEPESYAEQDRPLVVVGMSSPTDI